MRGSGWQGLHLSEEEEEAQHHRAQSSEASHCRLHVCELWRGAASPFTHHISPLLSSFPSFLSFLSFFSFLSFLLYFPFFPSSLSFLPLSFLLHIHLFPLHRRCLSLPSVMTRLVSSSLSLSLSLSLSYNNTRTCSTLTSILNMCRCTR